MGGAIKAKIGTIDKKHYQQYRYGLEQFLGTKRTSDKAQRAKLTKRVQILETEKSDVINKKLAAIQAYQYDDETKNWCRSKLKELDKDIGGLKADLKKCTADSKYAVANFKKFIELKENLHWYWHNANEAQKKALAEILVLNCVVRGQEIRSISWKSPLADVPKSPEFYRGGASCHSIEPYLAKLWNVYVNTDTTAILEYKEGVDSQNNFDVELLLKVTD